MSKKARLFLAVSILVFIILSSLACEGGDMDRSWMTSTVEAAIVKGEGR